MNVHLIIVLDGLSTTSFKNITSTAIGSTWRTVPVLSVGGSVKDMSIYPCDILECLRRKNNRKASFPGFKILLMTTSNKFLDKVQYIGRVLITVVYFACSLTTSSLILLYSSCLGHDHWFCRRMRSVLAVVTCGPWMLCFGVRLSIQNEDLILPADLSRRVIHVGTHASHLDGLSMMVAYWRARMFRIPPCAMVKREVLLTPFYGVFAYLVGNVFVSRGNGTVKQSAIDSMNRSSDRMKQGYMMGVFPEGTRRRSKSIGKEHLLPYKKGGFHLAVKMANDGECVTLVPFCLVGSRTAWPSNRLVPTVGAKITLVFLPHITVTAGTSAESLLEQTRIIHEGGIEKAARNAEGKYDISQAFENGTEINLAKEFLFEAVLLTIPPIGTLIFALVGLAST